jgi:hypothetical protein
MKKFIAFILAGAAVGGLVALFGPHLVLGRLPYTEFVFAALVCWIPLLVILLALWLVPRLRSPYLPGIGLGITAGLAMALLACPQADQLKRVHNRLAKRYCMALIPQLEEYHAQHGEYPDSLEPLTSANPPPRSAYLRGQYYWKVTNGFSFSWVDSPGIPICSGVTVYDHASSNWDSCADWGSWED